MPRTKNLLRLTGRAIATLAIVCVASAANAQSDEAQDTPDAQAAPETVATDADEVFDEPVDLSPPLAAPSAGTIDHSKFMHGLPSALWTSKAGINSREATPHADWRLQHWLPGALPEQTVGVAWANITAPGLMAWDRTAIETRLDPYQQGRVGVTLSRSVPVTDDLSMTLQNGFAWTQPLLQNAPVVAHESNDQVIEGHHAVRFTLLPVHTTLSIGAAASSVDDRWLPSLSAEQKLWGGPLSITGAVSETATGELDSSLKAGFKRTW